MSRNKPSKDSRYQRKQGKRGAYDKTNQKKLTYSYSKHIDGERGVNGQTFEEWEKLGLLAKLTTQMKYIGQLTEFEAKQQNLIKIYTKVGFPPNSKFKEPKHVKPNNWAVMHITPSSKEVVAGYIENSVFYIVFLDKDHLFWPSSLKHT
ncbi:hypothetical protein E0494_10095 [Marinilabiliaceae bacterium JC040]|nr:hypothetical protein [Marinilabiliaceae bacterium JC040]